MRCQSRVHVGRGERARERTNSRASGSARVIGPVLIAIVLLLLLVLLAGAVVCLWMDR